MADAPPQTRRQWFRFSLATMFVVITLIAFALAWEVRDIARRAELIAHGRENLVLIRTRNDWLATPELGQPPAVKLPFWRRWLGEDPPVEMCFWLDGSKGYKPPYLHELRTEFPDARYTFRKGVP